MLVHYTQSMQYRNEWNYIHSAHSALFLIILLVLNTFLPSVRN